jgi:hypothetical protein
VSKPHVSFEILLAGLEAAVERLRASSPGSPEAFHAAFEALAWVGTIRDRLHDTGRMILPMVNGLYFVRNVVLHQGADILEWIILTGAYGEGPYGVGAFGGGPAQFWMWPLRSDIPNWRSEIGLNEYDQHIASHDALDTFTQVLDELTGAQSGSQGLGSA